MPENEIVTVPLFRSGHAGFGDGRQASREFRYNRVLRGLDARTPGELKWGPFITTVAYPSSTELDFAPVKVLAWRDPDNTADAVTFIVDANFPANGGRLWKLQNGAITEMGTNLLTNIVTDAVIHDNGSGEPHIYFAEGHARDIERASLADLAGTPGLDATAITGDVERDKLASINGYLYGSTDPAGTGNNTWSAITFVLPGAEPFTEANWSAPQIVGSANTDITAIVRVQSIPCVVKPEGIYIYNRALDLWENRHPAWETMAHPDNGRGAFTLGAAAVIPKAHGGAVIFDGYKVREFDVFDKLATPNADTTGQQFACFGMSPSGLLAVTTVSKGPADGQGSRYRHGMASGQIMSNSKQVRQGGADDNGSSILGGRCFTSQDNGATFTDATSNVTDGDLTTGVTLSSFDTLANGDFMIIGHPRPFQAIFLGARADGTNFNTNAATMTVEVWNGSAWVTCTHVDFTSRDHGNGQASLGRVGLIVMTQDPIEDLAWAADTIDNIFSVSEDTQSNYYIRISWSAQLDASVIRVELGFLPWRPSIDPTNFPEDGMDRAGCFPHLLWGEPSQEGTAIWHDLGAIMTARTDVDEIGALAFVEAGGSYGNLVDKLVAFGRRQCYMIEDFDPRTDAWPFISPAGLLEWGSLRVAGGKVAALREVRLELRDADALTNLFFYYRYDENMPWAKETIGIRGTNATLRIMEPRGGVDFQYAIGFLMSEDTVVRRPKIVQMEADFEVLGLPPEFVTQRPVPQIPRG